MPPRHRIVRLPVTLKVVDATTFPVMVEASFVDADGEWRRVVDKEPVFRNDGDPAGEGLIVGLVLAEDGDDVDRVLTVSLATPMGLVDDRGRDSVDILATSLRQNDTAE